MCWEVSYANRQPGGRQFNSSSGEMQNKAPLSRLTMSSFSKAQHKAVVVTYVEPRVESVVHF